jgi:hypothetical protein
MAVRSDTPATGAPGNPSAARNVGVQAEPSQPPTTGNTDPWEGTLTYADASAAQQLKYPFRRGQLPLLVAAGISLNLVVQSPRGPNLATTALVWAVASVQLRAMPGVSTQRRVLVVVAMVLGAFFSVRTDPLLARANAVAIATCLVAASLGRTRLVDYRPLELLDDVIGVPTAFADVTKRFLHAPASPVTTHRLTADAAAAVARGLLLALPVTFTLAALLTSADVVFDASLATLGADLGASAGHLLVIAVGTVAAGFIALLSAQGTDRGAVGVVRWQIGRIEALVVLGGLNLLFAVFALSHVRGPRPAPGQSAAELTGQIKAQAREGFFQLLWVAGITLVVVLALRALATRRCRRSGLVRTLSISAIGLTLVVLAVAVRGLARYIADNGLTPMRFYSLVMAAWLAWGCTIVAARMLGVGAGRAWTLPTVVASALLTLVALNIANPEAVIARENLRREDHATFWHFDKFSADGLVEITRGFHRLPQDQQEQILPLICGSDRSANTAMGWNRSLDRAEAAARQLCGATDN